jgi:predicted glycosyltransferase involved in capsule biosynthesis
MGLVEVKYDLKDTTFIIPVRIEDDMRLNNINLILKYINYHFDTNIIVCESSSIPLLKSSEKHKYIFNKDDNPVFYRTKILNFLIKQVKTPYVINCDADVLVRVNGYCEAIQSLRKNIADFVFPYSGYFYNVPTSYYKLIESSMSVDVVNLDKCEELHSNSVGGIVCMNKDMFIKSGMENEKFISWGAEDLERVFRWQKLQMRLGRIAGPLYHMNHNRQHINSSSKNPHYLDNEKEYKKIATMTKEELIQYMKTWDWLK